MEGITQTVDQLIDDVVRASAAYESAQNVLIQCAQKAAEAACPHKVGDTITLDGSLKGSIVYAHHGKRMTIKNIKGGVRLGWLEYSMHGVVLKKDGTPGTVTAYVTVLIRQVKS